MRGTHALYALLLLPMAVAVEIPSDSVDVDRGGGASDPASTTFRVAGGGGRYLSVVRDCSGAAISSNENDFGDLAGEITHRFAGGATLGMRGGYLDDNRATVDRYTGVPSATDQGIWYANPLAGVDTGAFGLTFGWIRTSAPARFDSDRRYISSKSASNSPMANLHIGRLDRVYLSLHYLDGFPLYSGGGEFDAGFGGAPTPSLDLWFGFTGGGVYDGVGALLKVGLDFDRVLELQATLRGGMSEGEPEVGVALGLGYHWWH